MGKTAILVDGAFFIRRSMHLFGEQTSKKLADILFAFSCKHLSGYGPSSDSKDKSPLSHSATLEQLYRIFYYDCRPLTKKALHPVTKKTIDFSRSDRSKWRNDFLKELSCKRKVALRLGTMDETNLSWLISPTLTKDLCSGKIAIKDLEEKDVNLAIKQKGVDMRIGLDIASLAFKKQVDRIVLISGDSDFVPAAKLARREGIDFILDPMWAPIKPDLMLHIDGLRSVFPKKAPTVVEDDSSIGPASSEDKEKKETPKSRTKKRRKRKKEVPDKQ